MISMQVGDHNRDWTVEAKSRVHHLALSALATIEEKELPIPPKSNSGKSSFLGRKTAARSEKYDVNA